LWINGVVQKEAEITLMALKVLEMSFEQQEVTLIWAEKKFFFEK
jgi:hypothetical protein